jgi:murein L,D-transpeptidase YcbB/YkuD
LFSKTTRAFSHGCIRINKAFELAEFTLKEQPAWDSVAIRKTIDQGLKRIIILQNPIPVHIMYLTATADDDGTAYFTQDIYNRDTSLINALNQIPPEQGKN